MFIFVDEKRIGFGIDQATPLPSPIMRIGLGTEIIVSPPITNGCLNKGNGRVLPSFNSDCFSFEIFFHADSFSDGLSYETLSPGWISLIGLSTDEKPSPSAFFYLNRAHVELQTRPCSPIFYLSPQAAQSLNLRNFQRITYEPLPSDSQSIIVLKREDFVDDLDHINTRQHNQVCFYAEIDFSGYHNSKGVLNLLKRVPAEIYFSINPKNEMYHIFHSSGMKMSIRSLISHPEVTRIYSLSQSLLFDLILGHNAISTPPFAAGFCIEPSIVPAEADAIENDPLHFVENDLFRKLVTSISQFASSVSSLPGDRQGRAYLIQGAPSSGKSTLLKTIDKKLYGSRDRICKHTPVFT
ncbi:hypothetical protein DI09_104p60 [Mitosporidium daphniae]|uniref:Uncharacterized protein n=1 Tax=Mitosporidium daphniae TaxID=1485682 RepID=A0A098VWD6_9MICR|nr:uncharacterized protein DI09_104p60 [Mitosporidium daphniae]KGG53199.1 hypothetical protein DI09_104p60 [Mitosporidium daphniae]|eukprot:XP_013239637.1 uncharacterized protein DI09_104p60 [Mitosporidium daphniae]